MMKPLFFLSKYISLALVLISCGADKSPDTAAAYNAENDRQAITGIMAEQEDAWNRGDIAAFMQHYWTSDSLLFIGQSGLNYGWQTTLDNYKKSYPDRQAMGRLQFTNRKVEVIDSLNAFVVGKWELLRVADTLSGHYSLLWKKIDGHWAIVADHSS